MPDRQDSDSATAAPPSPVETEGKWLLAHPDEVARVRAALEAAGAQRLRVEQERNELYDLPDGTLHRSDRLLRLRIIDGGPGGRLTVKGLVTRAEAIKSRAELEIAVDDTATARAMLEMLGYTLSVMYPKTRETWRLGALEVAVDQLPFGWYCEIEGAAADIGAAAALLALTNPEPRGYPGLMRDHLRATRSGRAR
jgi:predicted adenylyl cyclase CyaB